MADIKETVDGLKEIADSKNDSVCECLRCKKIAENALEVIGEAYTTIGRCYSKIDELIEKEWIYVTDDKPKSSGVYNVARWFVDGERKVLLTDSCYFDGSVWHDDTRINHSREYMTDKIVAWMQLPNPPQEGEQE